MPYNARTLQVTYIRDSNRRNNDRPFHLEVKVTLCEAHLQLAGSKVKGAQTAQSDISYISKTTLETKWFYFIIL